MDKVKAIGFWNKGFYSEYSEPFIFNKLTLEDGEFLIDPLMGHKVAVKINDKFYLFAMMFSPLEFDHVLEIGEPNHE